MAKTTTEVEPSPFESAERWDVSTDTLLPVGNHVVTIIQAENGTTRTSGNPQIELKLENAQGSMRDWMVYNEKLLGKVSSLYEAAGVQLPQTGEFNPEDHCRLTQKCVDRLTSKKVGIVIREEPQRDDPTKMRRVIKGYVTPDRITSDMPADTRGLPQAGQAASPVADDDLPF